MTIRHYYTDATTTRFAAMIVDRLLHDGRPAVVLDQTYFYPSSGGQPNDVGRLGDRDGTVAVLDVVTSGPDAPVIHVLGEPWTGGDAITAEIDWPRRFDHMQQHTGQHILSQAFIRVAEAETVGFHLSDQTVTIDLATAGLDHTLLSGTEQLANDIVWANVPVAVRTVDLAEAQQLALRKLPPGHDGRIRLVAIGNFDLTACGGTHVDASGQVGLIKLVKTERRGDLTRIEFRCGRRALNDYGRKHDILSDLAGKLTTGPDDLVASVSRLQEDGRHWQSMANALQKALVNFEAEALIHDTVVDDGQRVIVAVLSDRDPDSVRQLANSLMMHDRTIALLGLSGERTHLVFGRSADAGGHMGELLRGALQLLDGAKGGGSATLAQGSGPTVTEAALYNVLDETRRRLQQMTKPIE